MKLLRFLKAHYLYSFNKKNIIASILFKIIIVILIIFISNIFTDFEKLDSNRKMYLELFKSNYYLIIKIIFMFYIMITSIMFNQTEFNTSKSYFISSELSFFLYVSSKIIYIIINLVKEILIYVLLYFLIMLIMPYGDILNIDILYYLNLFIIGLYYMLLSFILIKLTGSIISAIIPFLISYFSNIIEIIENESIRKIVMNFIPNIDLYNYNLTCDKTYFYILFLGLVIIDIKLVIKKK